MASSSAAGTRHEASGFQAAHSRKQAAAAAALSARLAAAHLKADKAREEFADIARGGKDMVSLYVHTVNKQEKEMRLLCKEAGVKSTHRGNRGACGGAARAGYHVHQPGPWVAAGDAQANAALKAELAEVKRRLEESNKEVEQYHHLDELRLHEEERNAAKAMESDDDAV